MTTATVARCSPACMWHTDPDDSGRRIHIHASTTDHASVFPGLHCVTSDRLDEALDRFTDDDWKLLARAFFDQVSSEILGCLDALCFDFNPDSDDLISIFVHIARRYEQHGASIRTASIPAVGGTK